MIVFFPVPLNLQISHVIRKFTKFRGGGGDFFRGDFPSKIGVNFTSENHIDLAVSEIQSFRVTDNLLLFFRLAACP